MAGLREVVHQIEYHWHAGRDLFPAASSMSQDSLHEWDSRVLPWIRHPHVDRPRESLCYQVLLNGTAALAWRYGKEYAAERTGGAEQRSLISRVLIGQSSLLTPEVAIALCRTGLPATAGPRPGQVTHETELPVIEGDELSAWVAGRVDEFDRGAARQEGLRHVVAAALSAPDTPLAVYLPDSYILRPPGKGLQCPLLWGLRRIVWPLLGTAGRGWSFSTFEPPVGDVNPMTLPDILFRQVRDMPSAPPIFARVEVKSRPLDLSTSGRAAASSVICMGGILFGLVANRV